MANISANYLQIVTENTHKIKWALASTCLGLAATVVHIPNKAVFNSPCSLKQDSWSFAVDHQHFGDIEEALLNTTCDTSTHQDG